MADALHPQTLVTYGMNGGELPVGHGGPLRLRVPRQLGYKSVKYITRLTVTDSLKEFGKGLGSAAPRSGLFLVRRHLMDRFKATDATLPRNRCRTSERPESPDLGFFRGFPRITRYPEIKRHSPNRLPLGFAADGSATATISTDKTPIGYRKNFRSVPVKGRVDGGFEQKRLCPRAGTASGVPRQVAGLTEPLHPDAISKGSLGRRHRPANPGRGRGNGGTRLQLPGSPLPPGK